MRMTEESVGCENGDGIEMEESIYMGNYHSHFSLVNESWCSVTSAFVKK
jgi:hypothetical protein